MVEVSQCLVDLARGKDATERVERRPVPEGFRAGLREQAVVGPQAGRKQRLDRTGSPVVDARRERNADPRPKYLVAGVVSVGFETFHRGPEVLLDGRAEALCLTPIIAGDAAWQPQLFRQVSGG